jgi:hypothetical protein
MENGTPLNPNLKWLRCVKSEFGIFSIIEVVGLTGSESNSGESYYF